MHIRSIDFLSQSPNNLIFEKDANKTFFGGLLFLFFFIAASLIFLMYYSSLTTPYEITSYVSQERIITDSQKKKFKESAKYNPTLQFKFDLESDFGNGIINDRFILYDAKNKEQIERNKTIERRVNDVDIYVLYKCKNGGHNCEIEEKDKKIYYKLRIYYQGFYIDPQRSENPIELSQKGSFSSKVVYISPDIKQMTSFRWSIVRCEDEKNLFLNFNTKNEEENY